MSARVSLIHDLLPDPKFGSKLVSKFTNCLMWSGKKEVASKELYAALTKLEQKKGGKDSSVLELFEKIINTVRPTLEVRSKRIGGSTYQIPVVVSEKRALILSMRWIIASTRKRKERGMRNQLFAEFMEILENKGESLKKRDTVQKMAEANKAFAHFA